MYEPRNPTLLDYAYYGAIAKATHEYMQKRQRPKPKRKRKSWITGSYAEYKRRINANYR